MKYTLVQKRHPSSYIHLVPDGIEFNALCNRDIDSYSVVNDTEDGADRIVKDSNGRMLAYFSYSTGIVNLTPICLKCSYKALLDKQQTKKG